MTSFKCLLGKITTLVLVLPLFIFTPIQAQALETDFSVQAKAALAIDANSGKILYSQNSDEVLGIASVTKILSAYLVYEEVEHENISWSDPLPISDHLIKLSQDPDLSNIPIEKDQTFTVQDALIGALVSSANSLTSALAEYIAGSEVAFVGMMYDKLELWGIHDALLVSASGLSNEYIVPPFYKGTKELDENMMSAKDVAIVAQHLITDYPEVLDITSQPSITLFEKSKEPLVLWNSSDMLPGFDYYIEGMDGLKTGTSPVAGGCYVGTMEIDGTHIITVVLGVDEEVANRFEETYQLLNYINEHFSYETAIKKDELASTKQIGIKNSKEKNADIIVKDDVKVWVTSPKNLALSVKTTTKQVDRHGNIKAPMTNKTVIAHQYATDKTDKLGYLTKEEEKEAYVDVTLKNDIKKDNIFTIIWHRISGKA